VLPSLGGASVAQAAGLLGIPVADLRTQLFKAFKSHRHRLLPGAREIADSLRDKALLAIATNAPAELVAATLQDVGVSDRFKAIFSADASRYREKPAPDVYSAACTELGVAPRDAIAFEDSAIGVMAARRAGLVVVYVPSNGQVTDLADLQVDNLGDPRLITFLTGRPPSPA
jgi:HAD superfamily hydrolase (TIGR01509 family)